MMIKRIPERSRTVLIFCIAILTAFIPAMARDVPPVSEAEFQKMKSAVMEQRGNWSYAEMPDWQVDQPEEKRVGQARWDVPTGAWYFNFGPTGIRVAFDINRPREALVMYVFPKSPAHEKIIKGDRIIGVNGRKFTSKEPFRSSFAIEGPRLEAAKAIEESEGDPKRKGILSLMVNRGGKTLSVDLKLTQFGYFSDTFPYNCKKSRKLAEWGGDWLIKQRRNGKHLAWGPPRMGDWIDLPAQLALLSFGSKYRRHFDSNGKGGVMWSWIGGIRLITIAEKQQVLGDKKLLRTLGEMSKSYAAKSGPSGAYSHKTWYKGAPFQLAFAAGLNSLGQSIAYKCGADIDEASYLRTRYLLTSKAGKQGNIGYGAANPTPFSAEDARKVVGNINPSVIRTNDLIKHRSVGGSACITLTHFVDPRDSFSDDFVKRGVRYAMATRWSARQSHACGSLTFVYNTLAASIGPVVGEETMYRKYMDDMKWWLIMARCHDGGWYFDPKIDKESNKYGRVHMTAAAILMLNAPLRELYVNGKGRGSGKTMITHNSSGSSRSSTITTTPANVPVAVASESWRPKKSNRKSRRLARGKASILNRALQQSLKQLLEKGSLQGDTMTISKLPTAVKLVGVEGKDWLQFQIIGSQITRPYHLNSLSKKDRAAISVSVANSAPESKDAQAMAGVFCEIAGYTADADTYFKKAGTTSRKKFEKLLR